MDPDQAKPEHIKFRNYKPVTDLLDGMWIDDTTEPRSITHLIEDKLRLITDEKPYTTKPFDPETVNWDLKRRLAPKLAALERETQRQIAAYVKNKKVNKNNDNRPSSKTQK